jgi:hypothetical protein
MKKPLLFVPIRAIRGRNPIFQTCYASDLQHMNEYEERRDKQLQHANLIGDKAWMTSGKISWFSLQQVQAKRFA